MRGRGPQRIRRVVGKISLLPLLFLLTACAKDAPQDFLTDLSGPGAKDAAALFTPVFWIAAVIFVIVEGALLVVTFKFRARSDRDVPVQVHGNKMLEITWTAIPALILAGVAVPTWFGIFSDARQPTGALQVTVTAKQWWWEYDYPQLGVVTANELHVPVGRPVLLTLKSVDVIHAFWVPKLAGKTDVIPGRVNKMTIQADEPGTFLGECAEFCAISHTNMRLRVIAQTASTFDDWVERQKQDALAPTGGLAQRGAEIFQQKACIGCHSIRGTKAASKVGPDLTHVAARSTFAGATFDFNEENLLEWVGDAPSMKPGVKMPSGLRELGLTRDEIRAIVAYLLSLE